MKPGGEFKCPLCGSSYFGTTHSDGPIEEWRRYCKGPARTDARGRIVRGDYVGCDFRWRGNDDAKYGLVRP